jgi:glycosyltransferase involved in cell wall biosynthesis
MRILIALTYFQPYKSGLTVYTVRLAHALAERGYQVTVLTSQYDPSLPRYEKIGQVDVIRLPVLMRVSKGVLMPGLALEAWKLVRQNDLVCLILPQLDAALIATFSRLLKKPLVVTYICDLLLPKGWVHWIANRVSNLANRITCSQAQKIVTLSQDYTDHSKFLAGYLHKVRPVTVPIDLVKISEADLDAFQLKNEIQPGQQVIGIAARFATEKGIEYLVDALPAILEKYPQARVLSYGQYQNLVGEEAYARRVMPKITKLGAHWKFLGIISDQEVVAFFRSCSVTVLPSINSTEAFGMVQIESMTCGTPVVASDLPGIRQPILDTHMGCLVPPRDSKAIAEAVIAILDQGDRDRGDAGEIKTRYSPQATAEQYEEIFRELLNENGKK